MARFTSLFRRIHANCGEADAAFSHGHTVAKIVISRPAGLRSNGLEQIHPPARSAATVQARQGICRAENPIEQLKESFPRKLSLHQCKGAGDVRRRHRRAIQTDVG